MTITRNDNKTKSILLILVCGVLWGTIGPFIRWMELFGSSAILTSFLRVFFAFIILACITIGKFGVRSLVIGKKALILCALLGIICHATMCFTAWLSR